MNKKIVISFLLVVIVSLTVVTVNASILDNIMNQASGFGSGATDAGIGGKLSSFLKGQVVPVIGIIGNLVFAGVTVILGLKYIWSSAEGKSQVSESLPAFVVAVIFFYLAESLVNWLTGSSLNTIATATSWKTVSDAIWGVIYIIVHYGSFAGIIYLGLKYMFASAEGKAGVKASFGTLAIGMIFVFSASNVVNFIVEMGKEVL